MTKRPPDLDREAASLTIGLGPGFVAGVNCHAVIETNRGHSLGRVIWQGPAEADTGEPEAVGERRAERVLRAPADGILEASAEICDILEPGQEIIRVAGLAVRAPFRGVLRGLLHPGMLVRAGLKIGDLDPRADPRFCTLVSDKALAIGGGVLEAILSRPELRPRLWK
jgi:xanthine dehydrogenase accessory factor